MMDTCNFIDSKLHFSQKYKTGTLREKDAYAIISHKSPEFSADETKMQETNYFPSKND